MKSRRIKADEDAVTAYVKKYEVEAFERFLAAYDAWAAHPVEPDNQDSRFAAFCVMREAREALKKEIGR